MNTTIETNGYTQIPNEILDQAHTMSNAAFKIVCVVCRKTLGWQREKDTISLSQFESHTGMTRKTVLSAIEEAQSLGWILREETHTTVGKTYLYQVAIPSGTLLLPVVEKLYQASGKIALSPEKSDGKEETLSGEIPPPLVEKFHSPRWKNSTKLVEKFHTQKKEEKKRIKKKNAESSASGETPETERTNFYGDLFAAILDACALDAKIPKNAKQISDCAKYLAAKEVAPDRIKSFLVWWRENDWRGKKGDFPKPAIIMEMWLQFEKGILIKPAPQKQKGNTYRREQVTGFTEEQKRKAEEEARRWFEEEAE